MLGNQSISVQGRAIFITQFAKFILNVRMNSGVEPIRRLFNIMYFRGNALLLNY
jgi:hypothetical protein